MLKSNISRFILLAALVVIIGLNEWLIGSSSDNSGLNRDLFIISNTAEVDRVAVSNGQTTQSIHFENNNWYLNDSLITDPIKVRLLFATLQQASVRRQISGEVKQKIDSLFMVNGKKIDIERNGIIEKSFSFVGDENASLSYFKDNEGDIYLVEIPGYNAFIAGLLNIQSPNWQHPNLFHLFNWRNLSTIELHGSVLPENEIIIKRNKAFFEIEGISNADTTRLTDYIDQISLLEADEYVITGLKEYNYEVLNVTLKDVGNNSLQLTLFESENDPYFYFGNLNTGQYFLLNKQKLTPLKREINYFNP